MSACNDCDAGSIDWYSFIPYIAPYVKGAPDDLMAHMARLAAIEFARESGTITQELWIDAQAGVSDYPLKADDCYTVTSIKAVCCGSIQLKPIRDASCNTKCLRGYRFDAPRDLYVYPPPQEDMCNAIKVSAVVIPGQDSCTVNPILYHEHAELIADGAVSRLLMTKGASWYDPQNAQAFTAKFLAAVRKAKIAKFKGRSSEPQFMKGVRFV